MGKDSIDYFTFIPFRTLPRATFLLGLCVLGVTHGFGVPQPPQLPPDIDQQAKPPGIPNPQVQLPTTPQPQQTTDPPRPPTTGSPWLKSSLPPISRSPIPPSKQAQPSVSPASNLQSPPPLHQIHVPPISHSPPSGPVMVNVTESETQLPMTSEPHTELVSINSSLENRPVPELPRTAAPFVLVKQPLQHHVDTTDETLHMVEPDVIHIGAPPSQTEKPLTISKPTNVLANDVTDPVTFRPGHDVNISPPQDSLEVGPLVTEPPKLLVSEPLFAVRQMATTPLHLVIQLFMGTYPVFCGNNPLLSCGGRCDQDPFSRSAQVEESGTPSIEEIMANGTRYTCMCDRHCVLYGDCCSDYFSLCLGMRLDEEITDYTQFTRENTVAPTTLQDQDPPYSYWATRMYMAYGSCTETSLIHDNVQETLRFWMVSKCPESYTDDYGNDILRFCHDGPENSLFSYPVSNRWFPAPIYKNIFCAFCHQVPIEDILFWHEVYYCSKRLKEDNDPDWSFQDVVDAAEIDCPIKSGARPPESAEIRFCTTHDGSNSGSNSTTQFFGHPYITGCQLDDPGLEPTKESAIAAACQSIFQPVWVPSESATFSSVHCALCSGISESVLRTPTCEVVSSPPARRQLANVFAEIGYHEGHLTLDISGSLILKGFLCSPDVPHDYAGVFVQKCPETRCPTDLQFSDRLTQAEMSCFIRMRRYPSRLWEYLSHEAHALFISKFVWHTHRPLTEELNHIYDGFKFALNKLCESDCPQEELEFFFQSISLNTQGRFHAEFLYRGPLTQIFPLVSTIDRDVRFFMFTPTTITNYQHKDDVCPNDPNLAIEIFDIPIVVQSYRIYAYVDLWGRDCFFDLENVGFFMEFVGADGPPRTVLTVILCWEEGMAISCNIPRPNVTSDVEVEVYAPPPGDPSIQQGGVSQLSNESTTLIPEHPIKNGSHSASTINKNNIVLEETKVFKTVCFAVCADASLISAIHNFVSIHGSCNLHMLLFFSLSKIALAVCMTLYLINLNKADTDESLMAISMHFGWIFGALSLAISFKDFHFSRNIKEDSNTALQSNSRHVLKWLVFTIIVCMIIIGLSIAVEEDSESDESIGYSSNSGHLFWMANRNGCYISSVAIIGACYMIIFIHLGLEFIKFRRFRLNAKSSDTCTATNNSTKNSEELALCEISLNSSLIVYFIHAISMYLIAVADYADRNNSFWKLMFCVASTSTGLNLLSFLWKDLVSRMRSSNGIHESSKSVSYAKRYSTSCTNEDGISQGHSEGQVNKDVDDVTAVATIDNFTSIIYAPE